MAKSKPELDFPGQWAGAPQFRLNTHFRSVLLDEDYSMLRTALCSGTALAIALCVAGAGATGTSLPKPGGNSTTLVLRAHSVYEAEDSLHRRGYYDVRLERASLPYSFNACKRGVRYHIHVNYYGDLVQVDPIGRCGDDDYGYYGRRRYYDNGNYGSYYDRYRYRRRYDD